MINGNAPKIAKPVGAVWRTVRHLVPSLPGFSHSGARQPAANSRKLHEHIVSNAVHMPWNRWQQAFAHSLYAVHSRDGVIGCRGRGKER